MFRKFNMNLKGNENTIDGKDFSIFLEVIEQLSSLREEKGLSYIEMGKRLGWTSERVRRFERNSVDITVEDLIRYARALDSQVIITLV